MDELQNLRPHGNRTQKHEEAESSGGGGIRRIKKGSAEADTDENNTLLAQKA